MLMHLGDHSHHPSYSLGIKVDDMCMIFTFDVFECEKPTVDIALCGYSLGLAAVLLGTGDIQLLWVPQASCLPQAPTEETAQVLRTSSPACPQQVPVA